MQDASNTTWYMISLILTLHPSTYADTYDIVQWHETCVDPFLVWDFD